MGNISFSVANPLLLDSSRTIVGCLPASYSGFGGRKALTE